MINVKDVGHNYNVNLCRACERWLHQRLPGGVWVCGCGCVGVGETQTWPIRR